MVKPFPSKTHIGNHQLHPETLMLNYGYDPELSEGSVKPDQRGLALAPSAAAILTRTALQLWMRIPDRRGGYFHRRWQSGYHRRPEKYGRVLAAMPQGNAPSKTAKGG